MDAFRPALLRLSLIAACGSAAFGLAACGGGDGGGPPVEPNQPPTASITSPSDAASFGEDEDVTFQGSADDPEDGALTGDALSWASDRDGDIGTGESVSATLSAGEHQVTLTATDSDGATASADVGITVNAGPGAEITAPEDGAVFDDGESIDFQGSADDPEDGALTGDALSWASDRDGDIGTGESVSATLSAGEHQVTLTATDSDGATASADVGITVNAGPGAEITAPEDGAVFEENESIDFQGSADDPEDGALTGDALSWASDRDGDIGTGESVSATLSAGEHQVTLTATDSDGATASADVGIEVLPAGSPTVTAVSPDPLREGGQATLAGTNFGPAPSQNRVVIDGREATVQSASETELVVTVPSYDCLPARTVGLEVTVGEATSSAVEHPLEPAGDPVSLGVGEQAVLGDPADHCLQFAATGAAEAYLVGVQSVSEADGLTTVSVRSASAGDGSASDRLPPASAGVGPGGPGAFSGLEPRWRDHYRAEERLRAEERRLLQASPEGALLPGGPRIGAAAASVPDSVSEGDVVEIRVPDRDGDLCTDFIEIDAEVRVVGEHGIWLTDLQNPDAGAYTDAELQSLADDFDTTVYPTEEAYFGEPTDIDGNGAGVFVISKEVNRLGGVLGFVAGADLFPRGTCSSSDEGELTYLVAPDPNGEFDDPHQKSDLLSDAPRLISHEFTHMIQLGRRLQADDPVPESWILEGQANFAEEVVGHAATGRTPGQNYGAEVALNQSDADATDWYVTRFVDLAVYYGFESQTSRVAGAPEECTWLVRDWGQGPCLGVRSVYGTPSSLFRWIADHFGPQTSGGEQALHRAIVDGPATGYALLEEVTGEPIETLLAQWAATLYVDDRVAGAAERLTLPSWDLLDISQGFVQTARLSPYERGFVDFSDERAVNGGSSAYYRLSGAGRPSTAVRFRSGAGGTLGAHMQVWIVRLQ